MNDTAKELASKGYLSAYIAQNFNVRYQDYLAIKSGKATLTSKSSSIIVNKIKNLLTNVDNCLKNQNNLLKSAKGLTYTGTLFYKLSRIPKDIIASYTGWNEETIKSTLSKLSCCKGKNEFTIKDNELLILYNIYNHQGSFLYVEYTKPEEIEKIDLEYEQAKDFFTVNNLDSIIREMGYKTRKDFGSKSSVSQSTLLKIAKKDFGESTKFKNILKKLYIFVNDSGNKTKNAKKVRPTYRTVRYKDLTKEEKEWYLAFDFNSIVDTRFGHKQHSIMNLLNKLGFDDAYYSTWVNLSKHITDYGNYILVKALYNHVNNLEPVEVNDIKTYKIEEFIDKLDLNTESISSEPEITMKEEDKLSSLTEENNKKENLINLIKENEEKERKVLDVKYKIELERSKRLDEELKKLGII